MVVFPTIGLFSDEGHHELRFGDEGHHELRTIREVGQLFLQWFFRDEGLLVLTRK
jgi:hypothetical protein